MKNIKLNKGIAFQGIVLFLIVILGVLYVRFTWISTENDKFDQTFQIARSIVATLPKEDLKALEAKPGDIDKPQYQVIKNILKAIIQINTKARFAYLYTEKNGKIFFIADSEPVDSKDYSPPGQEYTEAKPEDKQPFRDGKELITDTMSDRWGTWTSVLIPIKDTTTGKTIAVFGMDFNAKEWDKNVLFEVIESSVLIELLLLAFLFLFKIIANNKSLKLEISEHRQAEEKLRESEFRFKQVSENAQELIWEVDENGLYTYLSPVIKDLLGYQPEEIVAKKHFYDLFEQENREELKQAALGVFTRKESFKDFVNVNLHKDGRKIVLSTSGIPKLDNKGNLIGYRGVDINITERIQAEESIRKQKDEFETIFNLVPAQIWYKGTHNNFIRVNRQACIDIGMTNDKIEGHSAEELFPSYAQQYFMDDLEVFNTRKPKLGITGQVNNSKGEIRLIHTDKIPVFGNDGEVNGLIVFVQDITEYRRAKKEIAMLAYSLKSINECVSITDLDDKILYVNESFLKTYGYDINELIGKHISIVSSQYNTKELVKEISFATIEGEWQGELLNKRKDGSEFPVYLSTSIIKDKDGKSLGLIGVAMDITERKRTEEKLKKLSSAVEQTVDTIVITDRNGTIEYVNHAFEALTGYSFEEAVGKTPRILKSGTKNQEYYEEMWETILSGKVFSAEVVNKKKNGDLYYEEKTISPIFDKNKTITHFVGSGLDITKRKCAEKELIEAKEKAEESNRLKTSFLNNISHEIRTPFNGLLGFLSLIQDDELPASERDEYISIINKSADRLMNTINDIVEISQIQAGQMKLNVSKSNIQMLASELYSRFKTEAESKELKFYINNDLPNNIEFIYTDSTKLNAILTILIGNAIKFTKTGSIQFGINLTDTVAETHGRASLQLQFSVKDTGVGISENKQQAIFEKFRQADGSSTRQFEGSGLGLSIAKAYVEMLGGKIWVESEEGEGSVFYFTIPYVVEPEEKNVIKNIVTATAVENHIDPEVSGLKILIAEDDEESTMLLALVVKVYSKEVIKVRTGAEAIEACRNNPDIDMVLMDIKMPDMNGHEATRQIRQFNRDVIIIAQTAYALTGDRERAIEAGCNDYISKPIKKEQFNELMQKYFKK